MDPITGAIVAHLSTAAGGMAGAATAETGKLMITDAYQALRTALRKKFGKDSNTAKALVALEAEPDFEPNQTALAGRLEQQGAGEDGDLRQLATALQSVSSEAAARAAGSFAPTGNTAAAPTGTSGTVPSGSGGAEDAIRITGLVTATTSNGQPILHTPLGKIQHIQCRHTHVMQHHQVLEFPPEG